MSKTFNVFILAAGLGERLRPITYHIPKPLLPVLGKPVLQLVLERVSPLPVNKIGINLHHKKKDIEDWIKQSSFYGKIKLFPEEQILGTGGALKNAEAFLKDSAFLVHNSDVLSDISLERLLEHHFSSENLVTLAVHDFPKFNNLIIDENGSLKEVGKRGNPSISSPGKGWRRVAFTGIAVYEPEFLKFLPAGASSVVDAWFKATSAGYRIGTLDVSGCYWSDIGTPNAFAAAVFDALRADGEVVYVHPSVKRCKNIDLQGYVVIEGGCIFDKNVSLKNCILLPKCNFISPPHPPLTKGGQEGGKGEFLFKNCIINPDFKIDLNEPEIIGLSEEGGQLIGTGGSDRKYYRIRKGDKSVVLMHCNSDDPDFERQIEYTRFFLKHSIPVPELIEVEPEKKQAIFEDAGDISLYSYLKCPREETEIENIYRQVIDVMVMIHTEATEHAAESPLLRERIFDYEYFRWETEYFIKRFAEGIRNIKVENISSLEKEFHHLASKADSFPKTIIHRDFQSQNIIITKNQKLRIIDYQGIRIGPPAYDVASILRDPYYRIDVDMRERLLDYYISQMNNKIGQNFDEDYFRETLLPCRLQRHMQALGAYGFLSSVKGKKYFLKYAPEGLRLLKEDIHLSKNEYPELYNLIMKL